MVRECHETTEKKKTHKWWAPKMDGENNGKPYEQMDDLGVPLFFGITHFQKKQ